MKLQFVAKSTSSHFGLQNKKSNKKREKKECEEHCIMREKIRTVGRQ